MRALRSSQDACGGPSERRATNGLPRLFAVATVTGACRRVSTWPATRCLPSSCHCSSGATAGIGEAAARYVNHPPVKPLIDLPRMSNMAQRMLHASLDAFVSRDVGAAEAVIGQDDTLDALKDQIFRELLTYMLGNVQTIEPGIELILIARHLERIGDHATNIAEDVIFMVSARDVRHHAGEVGA